MAEYQGMKVKLNSPTAIRKGEPGYGRKSKKLRFQYQYTAKQYNFHVFHDFENCLVVWKSAKMTM